MHAFLSSPLAHGALTGLITAAAVDVAAFRSWKSVDEAMHYAWKLAAWRWVQGVVWGVLTAAGMRAL